MPNLCTARLRYEGALTCATAPGFCRAMQAALSDHPACLLLNLEEVKHADAVLVSGTGLPTAGIIEDLERELGKPVVTSQQASLWLALRLARVADSVPGFGRLLREPA